MLLAVALGLSACGSDDEEPETQATSPPTQEETATEDETATETEPETETETEAQTEDETETSQTGETTSPEDEQGGAGDEEPARTLALFTASNGRITPRVIRVPSFISVRVELRARDGNAYALSFPGRTIEVSDALGSVSFTLDGLRPGEVVVGRARGASGRVRIEATAEPGP